ncbi:MAG: hypothetical protein H8E53_11205 [Planctomycetes bacterium]|nr:hypothetical protein [Planctomycetota bacterium]
MPDANTTGSATDPAAIPVLKSSTTTDTHAAWTSAFPDRETETTIGVKITDAAGAELPHVDR